MKIAHYTEIPVQQMQGQELKDVKMRVVIGPDDGAPNFVMRLFEVGPGGYTPLHTHDWEHEVFIKSGQATLTAKDGEKPLKSGDAVFIAANELHQFRNTGEQILEFICLIPAGVG